MVWISDAKRSGHVPEIRGAKTSSGRLGNEPHSNAERLTFMDGRIIVRDEYSGHGNVNEIIGKFGGVDQLRHAKAICDCGNLLEELEFAA